MNEFTERLLNLRDEDIDEIFPLIRKSGDINGQDDYGRTPLMNAVISRQLILVRYLIDHFRCNNPEEFMINIEQHDKLQYEMSSYHFEKTYDVFYKKVTMLVLSQNIIKIAEMPIVQ